MTLDALSHTTVADVNWGGVLRSERLTAECLWFNGLMRFCPLYRGRCLGNVIMCYVDYSIETHKSQGWGADQKLKGIAKRSVGPML